MAQEVQSITAQFMDAHQRRRVGGRGTRERAHSTFVQLERIAKLWRWRNFSPETLTKKQLKKYVEVRREEGIKIRSIESELSAIRRALEGVKRHIDAQSMTRTELGLEASTRKGKGQVIDETVFQNAIKLAEPRTAALMRVQYYLGLRINEAIECRESLPLWEKALRIGSSNVELSFGAKNGRGRTIYIHPQHRSATHVAVLTLLALTDGGKEFPISEANNGDRAARIYNAELAALGMKGEQSSHAIRRRFATNQYRDYRLQEYSPTAALARVAIDLGHGATRGRWVLNNYIMLSLSPGEIAEIPGKGRPRKSAICITSQGAVDLVKEIGDDRTAP